jgi:WD40 repeat protein
MPSSLRSPWIRGYDSRTGREIGPLGQNGVIDVAFSPDSTLLATALHGQDKAARVVDARTGREVLALSGAGANSVAFSANGEALPWSPNAMSPAYSIST